MVPPPPSMDWSVEMSDSLSESGAERIGESVFMDSAFASTPRNSTINTAIPYVPEMPFVSFRFQNRIRSRINSLPGNNDDTFDRDEEEKDDEGMRKLRRRPKRKLSKTLKRSMTSTTSSRSKQWN